MNKISKMLTDLATEPIIEKSNKDVVIKNKQYDSKDAMTELNKKVIEKQKENKKDLSIKRALSKSFIKKDK